MPGDGNDIRLYRTGLLYNALSESGDDVVWWTSSFNHTSKELRKDTNRIITNKGSSVFLLKALKYKTNISLKRAFSQAYTAIDFKNSIKKFPVPDIIIGSFPTIELCREAVKFSKKNNIPVIIDVRDLWPDIFLNHVPRYLKFIFKLMLTKMYKDTAYVFKNATCITAVSKAYLDWGLKKANRSIRENDLVFPHGYPINDLNNYTVNIAESYMQKLGFQNKKPTILFIGTFGETYDLKTVIRAIKAYPDKFKSIQFVFCGNGPKYNNWRKEAAGLECVIFTGWIDSSLINYLLNKSSVGLAAYKTEAPQGLPNKIFEYMSTGLPILSSLQGETDEFLRLHNIGITYKADNLVSFVEQIDRILNLETQKTMRQNSNELFKKKFTSSVVYSEYITKIREIAQVYVDQDRKSEI